MMKHPLGVVEPQKNRTNNLPTRLNVFPVPEAAYDTVRTAVALDLLHAFAAAGLIGKIETFGDHAIASASSRCKPLTSVLQFSAGRREAKKVFVREVTGSKVFKQRPSSCQRFAVDLTDTLPQKVKREKQSRSLLRQLLHAACSGMNALQKIIE